MKPLVNACQGTLELAVKIETDVNAPALAEYLLVKDQLSSVAYVTVGTGKDFLCPYNFWHDVERGMLTFLFMANK